MTQISAIPASVIQLQRVVALFAAWLMISVWPLWTDSPEEIVRIPWWTFLCGASPWIDRGALAAVVEGICILAWGRGAIQPQRVGLLFFTVGLFVLVASDQHRLQPWVCQFLLFGVLFLIAPNSRGIECWKIITASIYLWSAVSKFDAAFLTSHGQLLLSGMLQPLGIGLEFWSPQSKIAAVSLFPFGELIVGVLLLGRGTRKYGLPASILMHVLLIWTLGVGLKHDWSVLIWNLFFIVQNLLLFGPDCRFRKLQSAERKTAQIESPVSTALAAVCFTAVAATYPVLETIGHCDHWPAWAVYSSRPAQVKVLLDSDATRMLPKDLQSFVGTPAPLEDLVPFSLEAWSFSRCHCPIYPQLRYKLAVTLALLESHLPDDALNVEIGFTPDRWTGKRERLRLQGITQVKQYCEKFVFNTAPR